MAKKPVDAPAFVYVKVTLNDFKPPIWRRLRVPVGWHLGKLSEAILRGMGWNGGHLHAFEIGGNQYSDPAMVDDAENERKMTIAKLIAAGVSRFAYVYDFGDNWDHSVLIEAKAVPPAETTPGCVAGARACPPEDCGGPPGYESLLEALAAPDKPESREILEWVDEDFTLEEFVLEEADRRVKAI
jgi:hypothetical protein